MSSKRINLPEVVKNGSSNVGLLLDRFADVDATSSQDFLKNVASQKDVDGVYRCAYDRWTQGINSANTAISIQPLKVQGRLVTGLGNASPLETGLSLHHTYGVPWLPASGLKGLAAHYCDKVWGEADPKFKKSGIAYKIMFGTQEQAGALVFHDGWYIPDDKIPFKIDVITVHHQAYYGGKAPKPTEFDSPVPVQFLSVDCSFKIAVQCVFDAENATEQNKVKEWAVLGLNLLQEALANWGFGGKTNAGYGRIMSDEYATQAKAEQERNRKLAEAEQKQKAAAAAIEKRKEELSHSVFKKKGDVTLAVVVADRGAFVKVQGMEQKLQCGQNASAKIGDFVEIRAKVWPSKGNFPTSCEIIEVL